MFGKKDPITPDSDEEQPLFTSGGRFLAGVALLLAIGVLLSSFLVLRAVFARERAYRGERAWTESREPEDAGSQVAGHWYGLCPKGSIHSIADFRHLVENDPLLAEHFKKFAWEKARLGRLKSAIWVRVTYRKINRIRVSSRMIRLPKGDGYLTDGERWVRTYCGNDYVLERRPARTGEGIDADALLLLGKGQNAKSFGPEAAVAVSNGKQLLMGAGTSGLWADRDGLAVVPEPNTFLQLATGMGCLGFLWMARKR